MSSLRPLVSLLFLAVILLAAYVMVYVPLVEKRTAAHKEITSLENEISTLTSRIANLEHAGPEPVFPDELLWHAASKADAELALQDQVVALAGRSGMTLTTFGTSGLERDSAQSVMSFNVEAEGPLNQIYAFLGALERLDPKVAVGAVRIRPVQTYGDLQSEVLVYAQITLWAFWEAGT